MPQSDNMYPPQDQPRAQSGGSAGRVSIGRAHANADSSGHRGARRLAGRRFALASSAALILVAGLGAGWIRSSAASPQTLEDRLQRQVRVVEKGIEEMLVDSPNLLVTTPHPVRGITLEGYGAVFSFDASLIGDGWGSLAGSWASRFSADKRRILIRKGGKAGARVFSLHGNDLFVDGGEDEPGDSEDRRGADAEESEEPDEATLRRSRAETYEKAKEELVQALLDYGATLSALPAGASVRLVACFDGLELSEDRTIHQLSVAASIDDLRAFGSGSASDGRARQSVTIRKS